MNPTIRMFARIAITIVAASLILAGLARSQALSLLHREMSSAVLWVRYPEQLSSCMLLWASGTGILLIMSVAGWGDEEDPL